MADPGPLAEALDMAAVEPWQLVEQKLGNYESSCILPLGPEVSAGANSVAGEAA